ncbi:MAG: NfeD family protein [Planctomycetota bacterium]
MKNTAPIRLGFIESKCDTGAVNTGIVRALRYASAFIFCACLGSTLILPGDARAQGTDNTIKEAETKRQGFLVEVELPLVGDRAQQVQAQIEQIASSNTGSKRPVVVLKFQASPLTELTGEPDNGGLGTRGKQFGPCTELARFLYSSSDAARVRLVAYLPGNVEGHGVLPILACEEIYMTPDASLGRAAIDEPLDGFIEPIYREVASRGTLPEPVVMSMLDPQVEVYVVDTQDATDLVVDREQLDELESDGKILKVNDDSVWMGGSLAYYTGAKLRSKGWVAPNVSSETDLQSRLGVEGALRTVRQLPRDWTPILVNVDTSLDQARVNQIIRGLDEQLEENDANLVVLQVSQVKTDFRQASRLASYLAELQNRDVYSISLIQESLTGSLGLVALGCEECVLLSDATLGPIPDGTEEFGESEVKFLEFLEEKTKRPPSLMSVLLSEKVKIQEFVNQNDGNREIFADWQMEIRADNQEWEARTKIAGGESISQELALKYRLVDSNEENSSIALSRLGVTEMPEELEIPWLDATLQTLLAQSWLPRLLLTIGFFALMAELGNPGIGAGGFVSGICFLGFFWVEGFNGNVEMLEIMLFLAGLVCLAMELFVVPGFGIFGIGGLLMLFVSVVLASQTFVWPTNSAELGVVASNLFWTACLALGGLVGLLFMHKHLEHLPMFRWIRLDPGDGEELDFRESLAHREHLLGQPGLTITRLNPSGKAQFGKDVVAVVGQGKMIGEGVPVQVVEVRGNVVIVEETEFAGT